MSADQCVVLSAVGAGLRHSKNWSEPYRARPMLGRRIVSLGRVVPLGRVLALGRRISALRRILVAAIGRLLGRIAIARGRGRGSGWDQSAFGAPSEGQRGRGHTAGSLPGADILGIPGSLGRSPDLGSLGLDIRSLSRFQFPWIEGLGLG